MMDKELLLNQSGSEETEAITCSWHLGLSLWVNTSISTYFPSLSLIPHWQAMKHCAFGIISQFQTSFLSSRMECFISLCHPGFCQVVNKTLIICVLSHQIEPFFVFSFSVGLKLHTTMYSWTSKPQKGSNCSFNSTPALTIVSGPNCSAAAALFTSLPPLTATEPLSWFCFHITTAAVLCSSILNLSFAHTLAADFFFAQAHSFGTPLNAILVSFWIAKPFRRLFTKKPTPSDNRLADRKVEFLYNTLYNSRLLPLYLAPFRKKKIKKQLWSA